MMPPLCTCCLMFLFHGFNFNWPWFGVGRLGGTGGVVSVYLYTNIIYSYLIVILIHLFDDEQSKCSLFMLFGYRNVLILVVIWWRRRRKLAKQWTICMVWPSFLVSVSYEMLQYSSYWAQLDSCLAVMLLYIFPRREIILYCNCASLNETWFNCLTMCTGD